MCKHFLTILLLLLIIFLNCCANYNEKRWQVESDVLDAYATAQNNQAPNSKSKTYISVSWKRDKIYYRVVKDEKEIGLWKLMLPSAQFIKDPQERGWDFMAEEILPSGKIKIDFKVFGENGKEIILLGWQLKVK